jgi:hypothetical protein
LRPVLGEPAPPHHPAVRRRETTSRLRSGVTTRRSAE